MLRLSRGTKFWRNYASFSQQLQHMEGDHSVLIEHSPQTFKSLGAFIDEVDCILGTYCWDTNLCLTIDLCDADDGCQIFEMPSMDILVE